MKIVTVKICRDQFKSTLTPEEEKRLQRIYDPQDLEDALLSVKHDALIARMQEAIKAELNARFEKMFFGPSH